MAEPNKLISLFETDLQLLKTPTEKISLSDLTKDSDYLALYFSAHWCGPCRNFTPKLSEFYKKHHKDKKFELVFVSSDKDEKSFNEYFAEMSFNALPYSERSLKDKFSKLFKINSIPSLVILDKNGEIVNANARQKVTQDSNAESFPWKPRTLGEVLSGNVVDHSGKEISIDSLKSNSANALYFSAHWCPPCRGFTPKLVETYKKLKASGKTFEIIFASSDNNQEEYKEYFETMPWLSLPLNDKRKEELSELLSIEGIPSLVILDGSCSKVINLEGRSEVDEDPDGSNFPWHPKPLNSVESSSKLNDGACLIYLEDNLRDEAKAKLQKVAEHYTNLWKDKLEHPVYFLYGSNGDLATRIRTVTNFQTNPGIFILDVQGGVKYLYSGAIEEEGIKSFVQEFLDKKVKSVGLRE